jgi:glycosyltransferase involved in cell wall biosynthesis
MGVQFSVVVPVYRSERTVEPLVARVRAVFEDRKEDWEIIFVDDSSPDGVWQVLERIRAADPQHVTIVQLMRNFGQHNATMCGFHHARGQYIVTLDDDLQNPPEFIPRLMERLIEGGFDVVYAEPEKESYRGPIHRLGTWVLLKYGEFLFKDRIRRTSYRLIRREVIEAILDYNLSFTVIDGLISWSTQRIGGVRIPRDERAAGTSGYNLARWLVLTINIFANFSIMPLQVVSVAGIVIAGIGFALGVAYVIAWAAGYVSVSGYTSLIVTSLIMGGTQLVALGIIGEYLGRVLININKRPQFIVRRVDGQPARSESGSAAKTIAVTGPGRPPRSALRSPSPPEAERERLTPS